jgi:hypothetical protein
VPNAVEHAVRELAIDSTERGRRRPSDSSTRTEEGTSAPESRVDDYALERVIGRADLFQHPQDSHALEVLARRCAVRLLELSRQPPRLAVDLFRQRPCTPVMTALVSQEIGGSLCLGPWQAIEPGREVACPFDEGILRAPLWRAEEVALSRVRAQIIS